jgi:hypothetical protein
MIKNNKQIKEQNFTNSFWGWLFVGYLGICLIYKSSILIPMLFFLWLINGWGIFNFISHNCILGSDSVKKCFTVFGFLGVLGSILLISVL